MKQCTKQEFDDFVKNYPRELDVDCCAIGEPPTLSYNDFTLGTWPDSAVASCKIVGHRKQGYWRIASMPEDSK